jgi:arabinofuranan 3-O-arabinosyltransferase
VTAPTISADRHGAAARPGSGRHRGQGRPNPWSRWADLVLVALPALLAYVPLLLTEPGQVAADTKTYLYLDPGKLLRDAPYIWDSQIGLGTVTHQNIGYLWPMGPFYWVLDAIGLPDWVAQRLWLGTVVFAAGMGLRWLLRTLDFAGIARNRAAVLVAVLAYMLSPYLLNYSARISVILLPWAALPWLLGLTARAVERGGWRYPALFALVIQTVGGINATALLLVGLGPLVWVAFQVWVTHQVAVGRALRALGRIGLLTFLTSLWWLTGLWAQGRYGLPVVRYTETYKTVAEVATAPEVLRGLGYWFFYGTDKLGPWIEPSATYTENIGVLALSYLLPVLALASVALVVFRQRLFFIALVVLGTLISVGSHPWSEPSLLGAIFKALTRTDAGLAMRSTPRAVPLVALGMAVFLGVGVAALTRRLQRGHLVIPALACLLIVANLPTLWTGEMVASNLKRDEDLPPYWYEAAAYLDERPGDTRVLELPGSDFAAYRWGNTVDPVTPGLMERPYAARELFAWGSPASANLLNAFDRRFHENDIDPEAVAPIARVLGAGDIVLRGDLQFERFRTARPRQMWDILTRSPGLGSPVAFGPAVRNVAGPEQPLIDEIELDATDHLGDPPPVAVFPVLDPLTITRTHPAREALFVAGDGDGLVDAAGIGLVDPAQAIFYAASYAGDEAGFDRVYTPGAHLLVTDTNRQRARRWGTLREFTGYTEMAGETPLTYEPGDQRLELFPESTSDSKTVTVQRGGVTVRATDYGNPVTYTPNDRAALALDGDPKTAWRVGAVDDPIGQRLLIDVDEPVTADRVTLTQPTTLFRNRWITEARLHFDDGSNVDVALGPESRDVPGQEVVFDARTFERLEIEITGTDIPPRPRYDGLSGVGFAEVDIPGVRVDELIRPPTDLLDRAGPSSLQHRLTFLFTRLRSNPSEPVRTDEEIDIARLLQVPTARAFAVSAQARLSAYVPDHVIDQLLGIPDATDDGVTATSSERLPGSLERRAHAAIDGDSTTHWSTPFTRQVGHHLDVELPSPITIDRLDLQVVADGRHSVPTRLLLVVDGDEGGSIPIDLPPLTDGVDEDHVEAVPVELPRPVTGRSFRVVLDQVRQVQTTDWYSGDLVNMPVAVAELGLPGVVAPPVPDDFDSGCRDDLLLVDGAPLPLRVTGTTVDALRRQRLDVAPCGPEAGTISLDAGEHVVRTGVGRDLGIDLDRVAFASAAGGDALSEQDRSAWSAPASPAVTAVDPGRVSYDVDLDAGTEPFWLVLGQSWSEGWRASIDGRDLGPPQVVDGYGNGWFIEPDHAGPVRVHVEWTPQRVIWGGLAASIVAVVLCLLLIWRDRRRGRAEDATAPLWLRPARATLLLLWEPPHGRVPRRAATLAALGLAAFAFVNVPFAGLTPIVAVVLGAAAFVVLRWRRGRSWLGLAGAACLALAALYIVSGQLRHVHESDFTWPLQFTRVHVLGLLAVFLLLAEGIRGRLQQTEPATEGSSAPDGDPDRLPSSGSKGVR